MIAAQPLDKLPRLADADLHGAWCNKGVKGGIDYGPDGYDMTRVGLPSDEKVGMTFDGATDYLHRVEAGWRSADSLGAFSFWIRTTTAAGAQTIVSSCDTAGPNARLQFRLVGGVFEIVQRDNDLTDYLIGSTTLDLNVWHHIVVMSTGTAYIVYLNGVLETMTVSTGADTGDWLADVSSRDNVVIGAQIRNVVDAYFDGSIKDVRYHSRPLTADEIMHDYRAGVPDDSLALHLHKHRYDLSRYEAEFDNVGGVVLGHEMEFNGVDNYLRRAVADWRSADNQGAISCWIKTDAIGAYRVIFISSDEGTNTSFLRIILRDTGQISITQQNAGDTFDDVRGGTVLQADRWYHLVVVSTGTTWLIYINGVVEALTILNGANTGDWLADTTLRDNVVIGAQRRNTTNFYFNGKIKDLHYHSEPKSAGWVKVEYDKTKIFY